MAGSLILVVNPGTASRKYALYEGNDERASLHIEWEDKTIVASLRNAGAMRQVDVDLVELSDASDVVLNVLHRENVLGGDEQIDCVGIRVVAPSGYFLSDHLFDHEITSRLEALLPRAPLHITATLDELHNLRRQFPHQPIVGVSDSAFHSTKPDYAWNYGLPIDDADRLDIKRFGYHGLSVSSVVRTLGAAQKLPPKLVVCHLGSGASATAVYGGKSIDTTMGYSPLEGLIMSTRSGSIDPTAVRVLKESLSLDDSGVEAYLNQRSGLLGLGGSADLRELLAHEASNYHAHLALKTYVHAVQKGIGQMTAALGGLDALVFTGAAGERSVTIRERIVSRLHYLDLHIGHQANEACTAPETITTISRLAHSKPIYVVPALEAAEIAKRTIALTSR